MEDAFFAYDHAEGKMDVHHDIRQMVLFARECASWDQAGPRRVLTGHAAEMYNGRKISGREGAEELRHPDS